MKLRFKPCPKPAPTQPRIKPRSVSQHSAHKLKSRARIQGDPKPTRPKVQPGYIRRMFTLSLSEYRILQICMQERGLDPGSYDAALQTILSEWKALKDQVHHPVLIAVPADMLPKSARHGEE
jgi:hypothetical protein